MSTEANTPAGTGISTTEAVETIASLLSDSPVDKQETGETQGTENEVEVEEGADTPDEHEAEGEEPETDEHDEPEGEQAEQPQEFELVIEGKPAKVTLDELTKGYLRQSDYTRKTTEIAEHRKALSNEVVQTQQERAKYSQALEQANALLVQLQPQEPNWQALYDADPAQYAAAREMWRTYQEQRQAVDQQRQITAQQAQADQVKASREFVADQQGKLLDALPAWKDAKVASTEKAQIAEWALANGFSKEELNTIADHRAVVAMRKAMLFDRAQATRAALKPTGQAPASKVKPATPGAQATRPNSVSEGTRAKQRLAKTGKVSDAAAALELFLD